jgi:hypothetical protein
MPIACKFCGATFTRTRPDANRQNYCGLICRLMDGMERTSPSGCWLWARACFKNGYGAIRVEGKTLYAHRVSYELHRGKIPSGAFVLHRCDEPRCVNPDHLSVGTPADNVADMMHRGRNHWERWTEAQRKSWVRAILDGQKQPTSRHPSARALKG